MTVFHRLCACGAGFDTDQGLTDHKLTCKPDPRDPDYSKTGIFVYHNCWKCKDGTKKCVNGAPNLCDYPHARND